MDQINQPSNTNSDRTQREETGRKRLVLDAADYSPEIEFVSAKSYIITYRCIAYTCDNLK